MTAPQAPASKKSLSVSRLVLMLILIGALGALGFDLYARHRMTQLDNLLKQMSDESENSGAGLSKKTVHDEVHDKIGREPSSTSSGNQQTESYDFPSIFYIHRVTVRYRPGVNMYDGHTKNSVFRFGGESE